MLESFRKIANKIALPFNAAALVISAIGSWFTYQNSGFSVIVWLPIAVIVISLALSIWGRKKQ
ncbi:TPA: hypothetical protein P7L42_003293 [Vibrio cholerae]|uniref:hypothetical protein n=1 Tax=Vibrio cholerae TaxID=666 RepID=UPI0013C1F1E3|nr:hypothetical protein [Vibrio cholerae]MCX9672148.1 hypothetical protein [Vibrio cholerae]MCX9680816.1 hypothetical protein [Vibrio cholerae]MCX9686811.1 hypothetical protein [Vibrio cholerae]MCX9698936.1 hypothetical protein [Vibrio cholerae]MCX9716108.1 hypothetical protein [Vibrio cholerae]